MSKPRTQMTPDMNLGTSNSDLAERVSGIQTPQTGRHPLNQLQDDIAVAVMDGAEDGDPMPIVETTREVIQHYNKRNMEGFDAAGFFVLRDVIVCEHGKKEDVRAKLHHDLDNIVAVAPFGAVDMRKKS